MLEKKDKPTEKVYRVIVAQVTSEGENTIWESQEITATSFWIDDAGNLRFMMAKTTIAAISPGNWQRVIMKDEAS
jgi:hypothetical protein